jgi:hypothetical protein
MSRNAAYDAEIALLRGDCRQDAWDGFGDVPSGGVAALADTLVSKMSDTYVRKDSDYAQDGEPMGNLRACEGFGIPAWKGVLVRMSDKKQRLGSFIAHGELKVEDEKIDDTMMDLANYALLGVVLLEEYIRCGGGRYSHMGGDTFREEQAERSQGRALVALRKVSRLALRARLLHEFRGDWVELWHAETWGDVEAAFRYLAHMTRVS